MWPRERRQVKDNVARAAGQTHFLLLEWHHRRLCGSYGDALTPDGKTYKLTDFLPTDWQMWEQNESIRFFLTTPVITQSLSVKRSRCVMRDLAMVAFSRSPRQESPGGSIVGNFGGTAQMVKWNKCWELVNRKVPPPNDILNGPRYTR